MGIKLKEFEFENKLMPMIECNDERIHILKQFFLEKGGGLNTKRIKADTNVMYMRDIVVVELIFTEKGLDVRFTICANQNPRWFKLIENGMILLKDTRYESEVVCVSLPSKVGIDQLSSIVDQKSDKKSYKNPSDLV